MVKRTESRRVGVLVFCMSGVLFASPALAQDADNDGVLDISDNCTFVPNSNQLDDDTDLVGDVCDCGPGCSGTTTTLGPSTDLEFSAKSDLEWLAPTDTGGPDLRFDLLRSTDSPDFSSAFCVVTDTVATTAFDATTPSNVFYYPINHQPNTQ